MRKSAFWTAVASLFLSGIVYAGPLASGFVDPPADARALVRWWWFGPNVESSEIVREIEAMKAGGFGGFELQTVYPLSITGNVPYLSDAYLQAVRLASDTAAANGVRVDVTLGSGWPFGGPHIPLQLAAKRIRLVQIVIAPMAREATLPPLAAGDKLLATFAGKSMARARLVEPHGMHVRIVPSNRLRTLYVVLQSPTGQQVKRAALGAEGPVLDHMSAVAVQTHLNAVGERLLSAFGARPPYAVFGDSLEVFDANWTDDLFAEFRKRRGYDLKPHLLSLFADVPDAPAIRHDWAQTLSELTDERYLTQISTWAKRHGTQFRAQVYGYPPVTLSSSRLVALPEGEGAAWRDFSTSRWASSANHLYGNAVTSAESWTWLHAAPFRATPLDVKAEADQLMLEGVNQFVAHGWPYSPPSAGVSGWSFYAAAAFGDRNPWWGVMADVNRYLQRMSFLLRQGTPVADVAIYLPTDDAFAGMRAAEAVGEAHADTGLTVSGMMKHLVPPPLTGRILDAGYAFDFIDAQAILAGHLRHKILIMPNVHRIAPAVYRKIADFAAAGGTVVAIGAAPDGAPGFAGAKADAHAVHRIGAALFAPGAARAVVTADADLEPVLRHVLPPDMTGAPADVGFLHRHLPDGDMYFVANTGNRSVTIPLKFRAQTQPAQWWDARDGIVHVWTGGPVTLAPYESRVFVFGAAASAPFAADRKTVSRRRVLNEGWSIAFANAAAQPLNAFASWTDMPGRASYSGVAVYARTLTLSQAEVDAGLTTLDFGEGQVSDPSPMRQPGTSARLDPPVREAAEVFVNGKRVGALWSPPYRISLDGAAHAGENRLEIRVSNTAINALSSSPPADYRALEAKYGVRFRMQNMDLLTPVASGLLQPPALVTP